MSVEIVNLPARRPAPVANLRPASLDLRQIALFAALVDAAPKERR